MVFDELSKRLPQSAWAREALRFTPVEVETYELMFTQAGLRLPPSMRELLSTRGRFSLASIRQDGEDDDEAVNQLEDTRGEGWAGRNVLTRGLELLRCEDLFQTFRTQRLAASAEPVLGALWVFAGPANYVWKEAFAFDTRFDVNGEYAVAPFDEDGIGEELEIADGAPHTHGSANFVAWAKWLTLEIVRAVEALDDAPIVASAPRERKPMVLEPYVTQAKAGQRWSSWVEGIWREALQRADVSVARAVLSDVGTLATKPSTAPYALPSAIDLLHRLQATGAASRRAGLIEMWGPNRPDNDVLLMCCDYLQSHAHEEMPAPNELLARLVSLGWPHREKPKNHTELWARALLWALGAPEPEQLGFAARMVLEANDSPRGAAETMWLRLETFAKNAGAL